MNLYDIDLVTIDGKQQKIEPTIARRCSSSMLRASRQKGTGYFPDVFNEHPCLLSVDSNPNAAAIVACHSWRRKGCQESITNILTEMIM
jgi:hypothetical protein